ncbi:Glycosyltransferase, group 1 family [Xenorhabdus bovienii str. kraussei Quebec]|uniref:Glycosyltransferase, group 1 family n=1 Tax=Xenorhabdus bovienii str. kraussei Quebec TaxID=1398203 RepID=A0A077P946_XENBV|nr:glycosyltransferase [Xenorhabdus bovienii]CDH21000.1 Glycosyltransferase, group 1 family [Xenorhabdus bovienii str. kraussei Quebec]
MSLIIVNATALSAGGALTILKQFLKHANNNHHKYLCFVSPDVKLNKYDNIYYIKVNTKSWIKRLYWDFYGIKTYLKKNRICFDKVISLQNTTVNIDSKQIIYLHQSIPFSDIKISISSIGDIKLYLYSRFYKFFIFYFLKQDTIFIVQTYWMKNALSKYMDENNIFVIHPEIDIPLTKNESTNRKNVGSIKIIYPASVTSYKNHLIILKAINKLLTDGVDITNLKYQITFNKGEFLLFDKKAKEYKIENHIEYLGVLSYQAIFSKYLDASALIFPSYIETFGLPLVEAASLGRHIIAADLPYAHDVLSGYDGVEFIKYDSVPLWAEAIRNLLTNTNKSYQPIRLQHRMVWSDFFKLI